MENYTYTCLYCQRDFESKRSRGRHSVYCKKNPDKKIMVPWNKGKTKESDKRIEKYVKTNLERGNYNLGSRPHTEESKNKISIIMKEIARTNPNYSGRYNRGYVKQKMCSNGMKVLGSWEQLIVEKAIKEDIDITKPHDGFTYIFENASRTYYPDFYIQSLDLFIEVKGYKTRKDMAKWDYFIKFHNKRLLVIQKREILLLQKNLILLRELCAKGEI